MTHSRLLMLGAFVTTLLVWAPAPSVAQSAAKTGSPTAKAATSTLTNINTASKSELTSVSGIDELTAQKIINGRPYARKRELLTKKIVSQTTYNQIKEEIVVKASKK
jgi:competence protein ComEA